MEPSINILKLSHDYIQCGMCSRFSPAMVPFDITVSAFIPLAVFILNWRVRVKLSYALSAASDLALAIFGFDISAMVASDVFKNAMHATIFQRLYPEIFGILLCTTLILWCAVFLPIEHKLTEIASRPISLKHEVPAKFFTLWITATLLFTAHIFVFVY